MPSLRRRLLSGFWRSADPADVLLTGPIQGDLLGAEHLAERARAVAGGQDLADTLEFARRARLLARLDSTQQILHDAVRRLSRERSAPGDTDPASEWLLDNYHVVRDHIDEVHRNLPRGYYRRLPELATGPLRGYPRIYELGIELISHSEARLDADNIERFVAAFQEVVPLQIGELWALPAMLRLGLIESVRRMTLRTLAHLDEAEAADREVGRVMAAIEHGSGAVQEVLHAVVRKDDRHTAIFVARLLSQLRTSIGASPALTWLERRMQNDGLHPDETAARATRRLAHTQFIMANSITSLRDLAKHDWPEFVERQSALEAALRQDPAGVYPQMTFATRDRYRHVVEQIARRSGREEVAVARAATALADTADAPSGSRRQGHVGFFLVGDGLPHLERETGGMPPAAERITRFVRANPDWFLVGGLVGVTVMALLAASMLAGAEWARTGWGLVLGFTLLPAIDIAVSSFNQLVTTLLPPRRLPGLDFARQGIPAGAETAVVVPTMFESPEDVEEALAKLEVVQLANPEERLQFAILSDFTDAAAASVDGDDAVLQAAIEGVRALNARHTRAGAPSFHLLHRPRRWNPHEGVWMGWERKRGKLTEFNELIRGGGTEAFLVVEGDTAALRGLRYVITLDADTVLPRGAAVELIGTMAHPLNRPVFDPARGLVVAGHGILQPRVTIATESAQATRFSAIHAGPPGIDPYTTAVSDVYQDLYDEGSFTGKGIYDVEAFTLATRERFPENVLLSHDLIEGNFARAGLATGVTVFDDFPSTYLAHARRKHRWIRGDWQLLPWLGRWVPGPGPGGRERNQLPLLSRWKIVDNLRRSTVELAQMALILAGWTVLTGSSLRWTLLGLGAVAAPWIISLLLDAMQSLTNHAWRVHYRGLMQDAAQSARQAALAITFLPHHAWHSADAIVRTLTRLLVTRRHLLEWQSAEAVERKVRNTPGAHWRTMWPPLVLVAAIGGWGLEVASWSVAAMVGVVPLMLLWLASPWVATWLGQSRDTEDAPTEDARREALRLVERHWRYFDTHVSAATHWLAPDNVQVDPVEVVALRTSPTNIGLQLLVTISAHDVGLLPAEEMCTRLERTFDTLEGLRRFRGHFYNWYAIDDLHVLLPAYVSTVDSGNLAAHLMAMRQACLELASKEGLHALGPRLTSLAARAEHLVTAMDFTFLYSTPHRLFSIGYHPDRHTLDPSYYDMLASEARLAVFVAIVKGDAPVDAWFRLGRALIRPGRETMLVSWSGSMFEYLMPLLVLKPFPGTLLERSDRSAIQAHIAHGREHGVPWGVSESAYNVRDQHLTYQYRAFGVPALALKRGLGFDLVIAPYASALAAMLMPTAAFANLKTLEQLGALGPMGLWDALDYTRPPPDERFARVRTVMAHHAGMTIVALTNLVHDQVWQRRFHADPAVRANELLLQERVPRRVVVHEAADRIEAATTGAPLEATVVREVASTETASPRVALLGDLPYTVMVTHAGTGISRHDDLAVNRWRADPTTDDMGQFCYLRDVGSGHVWSSGYQPTAAEPAEYRVEMAPDRLTIRRMDGPIETRTEIVVVPSDAAEVRRVTLINHGTETHEIELTSYAEVVLGSAEADAAHPAFASLFIETEWHEWCSALTARRRPRRADEAAPWCVHVVDTAPHRIGAASCETDRAQFLGRGRGARRPLALDEPGPLSGTTGAVLDPVLAIRVRVRVASGASATVAFTTLVAESREHAFELADRYHGEQAAQRALELAWMETQSDLREWGISSAQAAVYQDLAGHLLFPGTALGAPTMERSRNRGGQGQLWAHGISGDLPILVAEISTTKGLGTLRDLFAAHRYWRRHGLSIDLVVVIAHPHDYLQELREEILEAMRVASDAVVNRPGGVFVRRRDEFPDPDYLMLRATARVVLPCDGRPLARVVPRAATRGRASINQGPVSPRPERRIQTRALQPPDPAPPPSLSSAANGYGELEPDGAYRIDVAPGRLPPAPWSNVIANPHGGFLVTERGTGCTWARSAYFYRLTPWRNDPVSDPPSDAVYLRDEADGRFWSVTPGPVPGGGAYQVRHEPGRTTYWHRHDELATELQLGLPEDAAVRLSLLRVTNHGDRPRHLTLTAYAEWTLGVQREHTWRQLHTRFDDELRAVLAGNPFEPTFAGEVAFLAVSEPVQSHTADRCEFLGRHGTLEDPAALRRGRLEGRSGSDHDPCAAIRVELELAPGETRTVALLLGSAHGDDAVAAQVMRFRDPEAVAAAIEGSVAAWRARLGVVTVSTPDAQMDAMLNTWVLYQAWSSRVWGRMGFYQSSGAFGFRDQLQDVAALLHADPDLAREHIVRAASRQFVEGDVQHWWHPHTGRGVRTRFSDDLVWLPNVVARYALVTGDVSVLDEQVPFLQMRELPEDVDEIYDLPEVTDERASVHEHCLRALRRACTRGRHGLPLIGTGDWNDGFSRVGVEGRGESVWLAWFLIATCRAYAAVAEVRGDLAAATALRAEADDYQVAVETHGWDGAWYRRAYYDDGDPLGSASSDDCQIDAIAQSWSVLSGAGDPARQQQAMRSLETLLVRERERLIMLLTPPFDHGTHDPGYIKGYLPGVRENGAQYTHAALWAVQATAMLGQADRAHELFSMLNPLSHASTPDGVARYRVEPYVVAADVYTARGHEGRGGWTWYTGSAGWMYRVGLETLLGFTRRGDQLTIAPRVPLSWPEFTITYRHRGTPYTIRVEHPGWIASGGAIVLVDGVRSADGIIRLVDDGTPHEVLVTASGSPPDP